MMFFCLLACSSTVARFVTERNLSVSSSVAVASRRRFRRRTGHNEVTADSHATTTVSGIVSTCRLKRETHKNASGKLTQIGLRWNYFPFIFFFFHNHWSFCAVHRHVAARSRDLEVSFNVQNPAGFSARSFNWMPTTSSFSVSQQNYPVYNTSVSFA